MSNMKLVRLPAAPSWRTKVGKISLKVAHNKTFK